MNHKILTLVTLIVTVLIQGNAQAGLGFLLESLPSQSKQVSTSKKEQKNDVFLAIEEAETLNEQFNEPTIDLSKEVIETALSSLLKEEYNVDGDLKLKITRNIPREVVHEDQWFIRISEYPYKGISESIFLKFQIIDQGSVVGEYKSKLKAEVWTPAYVSNRYINRGTGLDVLNFSIQPVNELSVRGKPASIDTILSRYESQQSIPKGDVLIEKDLKRIPDIRKGDIIDIRANDGLLNITMKARALQDGIKNDMISARNLSTKKTIQVLITHEGNAKIFF